VRYSDDNCAFAGVQYRIEPREIKARLDAPIVQAVIKMGFDRNVIRKAIEQRLMTTGERYSVSSVGCVDCVV